MSGGGRGRHNRPSLEGHLELHSGAQRKFLLTGGQGHYREAEWCGLMEKESAKSYWGWASGSLPVPSLSCAQRLLSTLPLFVAIV